MLVELLVVGSGSEASLIMSMLEVSEPSVRRVSYIDARIDTDDDGTPPHDGVGDMTFRGCGLTTLFKGSLGQFLVEDDLHSYDYHIVRGIGDNLAWYKACELLKENGFSSYKAVWADDSYDRYRLSRDVKVGGSVIHHGVHLGDRSQVGDGCIINTRAVIEHDVVIGDGVFIGPGAILCGGVRVEDYAFIGAGVIVAPGLTIGEWSYACAGTTVIRNVDDGERIRIEHPPYPGINMNRPLR